MQTSASSALLAAIACAHLAAGGACKRQDKGNPDSTGSESASAKGVEPEAAQTPKRPPIPVDIEIELRGLPDGLDATALTAAIERLRPEIARCYAGRMGARPGLSGTDVFDVAKRESGFAAQVATTEMKDAPLARCLIARLGELELAVGSEAPAPFQLALTFSPHGEARQASP